MDTPERGKFGPPANSKFEDSPVFNFINNLSPIQPVKSEDSVHNVQAYQSLNFASISSIFTSPHVNPHKDSRLLIRHPFSELSKHEISSDNVDESNLSIGVPSTVRLSRCTVITRESCSVVCSLNEATVDPPDECPTLPGNLPRNMRYGTGSPDHNTTPCYGIKMDLKLDKGHSPVELAHFVQDGMEKGKGVFSAQYELQDNHTPEQNKDDTVGCDWENLISDNADGLLIFDTSIESETYQGPEEKLENNDSSAHNSFSSKLGEDVDFSQRTKPDDSFGPCVQNATQDAPVNQSGEAMENDETDHTPQMFSGSLQNQAVLDDESQKMAHGASDCIPVDYKVDSRQQRGMRRRCLVFEVSGVSRRNFHNESNPHPSNTLPSNDNMVSGDQNLKTGTSPLQRLLPGIGLHLNTLATTSKDKMITQETLASGKQIISMPCSIRPFLPTTEGQKTLKPLAIEKDMALSGREVQECQVMHDDASQGPSVGIGEESSHGSPKKKRRKSENGGESEGCKRCNCKKSKCLKLYCECFAAGVYCSEPCSCQGCFNKPIHEETVLATRKQIESRNPLAFAPKVIRTCETGQEIGEVVNKTPASARHKKGCNCKKSSCLKKYCECYQGGVGCSISCRCEGCKNAFGRKDGGEEIEQGEEDADACETERDRSDDGLQRATVHPDELVSSDVNLPITPFQPSRSLVKQPVFSSAKPLRSSKLSVGFSAQIYASQLLQKSEVMPSQDQFEKHVDMFLEDDTPDILKGSASPSNGVKIASPNRKRVSPPHNGIGLSPSRKGGRKLILKSIPSFPSLSNDVPKEYPIHTASSSFSPSTLS